MKKLILLLTVLIFTVITQAQNADLFRNTNKDSAIALANEIAKMAKTDFEFHSYKEVDKWNNTFGVTFRDKTNHDYNFTVFFQVYNEGENKALEIPGTPRYYFYSIRGNFLDVFPFWQKYIDPNADKVKLSNNYSAKVHLTSKETYQPDALLSKEDANDFKILIR